jgi:hypothetical protein
LGWRLVGSYARPQLHHYAEGAYKAYCNLKNGTQKGISGYYYEWGDYTRSQATATLYYGDTLAQTTRVVNATPTGCVNFIWHAADIVGGTAAPVNQLVDAAP